VPDLGYDWVVRPGRDDLPAVAQGHSAKEADARMLVEVILLSEPIAERAELTGPGGRVWTCRLDAPDADDPLFPTGRPRWNPENWNPEKPSRVRSARGRTDRQVR
jgi:hypothetical protein